MNVITSVMRPAGIRTRVVLTIVITTLVGTGCRQAIAPPSNSAAPALAVPRRPVLQQGEDGILLVSPTKRRRGACADVDPGESPKPRSCEAIIAECRRPRDCLNAAVHHYEAPYPLREGERYVSWSSAFEVPKARPATDDQGAGSIACRRRLVEKIAAGGPRLLNELLSQIPNLKHRDTDPHLIAEVILEIRPDPVDLLIASKQPFSLVALDEFLALHDDVDGSGRRALIEKAVTLLEDDEWDVRWRAGSVLKRASPDELRPHVPAILNTVESSLSVDSGGLPTFLPLLVKIEDPRRDALLRGAFRFRNWKVVMEAITAIRLAGQESRFAEEIDDVARNHGLAFVRRWAAGKETEDFWFQRWHPPAPMCDVERCQFGDFAGMSCDESRTFRFVHRGVAQERRLAAPAAGLPEDLPTVCIRERIDSLLHVAVPDMVHGAHRLPDGGWLAGVDGGEFGGALVYITPEGKGEILSRRSFSHFIETPHGLLGVHGKSHLASNDATLYRIDTTVRPPTLTFFVELSGNVIGYWQEDDGTLLFATRAGLLSVDTEGNVSEVGCVADAL